MDALKRNLQWLVCKAVGFALAVPIGAALALRTLFR